MAGCHHPASPAPPSISISNRPANGYIYPPTPRQKITLLRFLKILPPAGRRMKTSKKLEEEYPAHFRDCSRGHLPDHPQRETADRRSRDGPYPGVRFCGRPYHDSYGHSTTIVGTSGTTQRISPAAQETRYCSEFRMRVLSQRQQPDLGILNDPYRTRNRRENPYFRGSSLPISLNARKLNANLSTASRNTVQSSTLPWTGSVSSAEICDLWMSMTPSARFTGYSRDELRTRSIYDIELKETAEEIAQHSREILRKGEDRFETTTAGKTAGSSMSKSVLSLLTGTAGSLLLSTTISRNENVSRQTWRTPAATWSRKSLYGRGNSKRPTNRFSRKLRFPEQGRERYCRFAQGKRDAPQRDPSPGQEQYAGHIEPAVHAGTGAEG